ncbi:Protein 21.1 [Giardia lamblia P15]|uniref:Protein 21.1 n=1 Tax=Giardia intestinalis (strain P15) TaxID=658858 RepID=E1F9J1_GIAIA|nr:Protein 21.1 [Giardia lamblia P15]
MSFADDSGYYPEEHDDTLSPVSEEDTDEESMDNLTGSSQANNKGDANEKGVTELMEAVKRNDMDAVKRYIPQQAGMVAESVKVASIRIYEGTALMVAAVLGHVETARVLMEYESGMRSSNEYTALMWAAANGRTEVVRLLLETEGGMQKDKGWTALAGAASLGHLECVKLLLEKEKEIGGESALCMASFWDHSDVMSLLESAGVRLMAPYP